MRFRCRFWRVEWSRDAARDSETLPILSNNHCTIRNVVLSQGLGLWAFSFDSRTS